MRVHENLTMDMALYGRCVYLTVDSENKYTLERIPPYSKDWFVD